MELTQLGSRFLREITTVVEDLDRSVHGLRDAAQLEAGDVTIGCVFSAVLHFLPSVIDSYRERHPNVLVRIIEHGADGVFAAVKHGEADFGINYIGMQESEVDFHAAAERALCAGVPRGPSPSARAGRCGGKNSRPGIRSACPTQAATASSSTMRWLNCLRYQGRYARSSTSRR